MPAYSDAKLRVLPRGTAMVPDYERHATIRRFHGWKHTKEIGDEVEVKKDLRTGEVAKVRPDGFVKQLAKSQEHVIDVPHTVEYLRHLRDGDLWPADQETAKLAGVAFDPLFGGEHSLMSEAEAKAARLEAAKAALAEAEVKKAKALSAHDDAIAEARRLAEDASK